MMNNIPNLDNIIAAYECCNGPWYKNKKDKCPTCPYAYFDDSGDGPGSWMFDEEKWEKDAYFFLKLIQHLAEENK